MPVGLRWHKSMKMRIHVKSMSHLVLLLLQVRVALDDLHLVDDQAQQIWHVFAIHNNLQDV
jgi:hypothetical protein